MQYHHSGAAPVYAPNSYGRPYQDTEGRAENGWEADGEMVRAAYTLHAEDDDFGQAHTLVRDVMNDAERDRLVDTVVGMVSGQVVEPVLSRVFEYWKKIDQEVGERIEAGVRSGGAA